MTAELRLIGKVAAGLLKTTLDAGESQSGCARFLLHALAVDEVVAIVTAIEADPSLSPRLDIFLPRYRYAGLEGVGEHLLTDAATTQLRHAECSREGRLMVLSDDSQMQSLAQVAKLDADALLEPTRATRWIDAAAEGLVLSDGDALEWEAALTAVLRMGRAGIRQVAHYLSATAAEYAGGSPLPRALGTALTALRVPRFDALFEEIPAAKRRQPSQWRGRLESHWRRESYIAKRDLTQLPFARAKLREKLEELRPTLREELQTALEAYVEAPDGVSETSFALFHTDWSELQTFFEEAQRSDGRSIGQETWDFYAIRRELLSDTESAYLEEFREHRRQNPTRTADDESFYGAHAHELREDNRLAALWERFIFGQKVECADLLDGLVQCLRRIYQPHPGAPQIMVVEGQERSRASFLPLNDSACSFFAARYRGLPDALARLVEFRHLEAFDYPAFRSEIAPYARRTPDAPSRRARQLSFKVWLETREEGATPVKTAELRLVWECDLKAVGPGMPEDLARLLDNRAGTPLVRCRAGRPRMGARSRPGGIRLDDLSTLEPEGSRDRGSFVPARSRAQSLTREWRAALDLLVEQHLVPAAVAGELAAAWTTFETTYRTALEAYAEGKVTAPDVSEQARLYGALMGAVVDEVSAPLALDRLLGPLLEVGMAPVGGPASARPAAVVLPWHPLRLAAQDARWEMLRRQLAVLLGVDATTFTDAGTLYFSELRRALAEPARPDVAVGRLSLQPTVLALVDAVHDYSLHEPPVALDGLSGPTSDSGAPVAREITDLVQNYLRLQPHEKDNLSVVLYNCDAAALPQAVVDTLRVEAEREGGEAMCQVMLRHRDEARLRDLYQQLVSSDLAEDSLHASETNRDFMSRLRISLMVNTTAPAVSADGPPLDIVFCHDVISRAATLGWVEMDHVTRPAAEIDSGHWSRRRPIRPGDRDAMVYLACPAQPEHGWDYLDAVAALHEPQRARQARQAGATLTPARQTNVQDQGTRQILEETHRLGAWVVNFDDLLDRRQLMDQGIRIIRYKHAAAGGRNLVISSQAPDALLRATLRTRIRALDPDYSDAELATLSGRLIDDANAVSGDIVLRAAKRGSNANELMGVVLSKFLVDAEIGPDAARAWIFLDDYAAWLGQDEKRIADLLCLAPGRDAEGRPALQVVVTEAKYVAAAGALAKGSESARQLRDTLVRLEGALIPEVAPADRGIWRARLSDMLLDRLREPGGGAAADTVDWRVALRDETCTVTVRGYSHVFAHAPPGAGDLLADAHMGVPGTSTGRQERYAPDTLRRLLRCYAERGDPSALRADVTGEGPAGGPESPRAEPDPAASGAARTAAAPAPDGHAPAPAPPSPVPATTTEPHPGPSTHFARRLRASAGDQIRTERDEAWLEEVAGRCRTALLRYGLSARLEHKVLTPNAALLKFKGSDELTVAAVERRLTELETTHALEVLSVRAEPGLVSISIRRPERAVLSLGAVWRDWLFEPGRPNNRLLIAVKEDDGSPLYLEPEPAPHTLVAGSTGSGKSILIQNLLLAIAATNRPDQAQIVLIDPKAGVDYFAFEALPHLVDGIIDEPEAALVRLEGIVAEMERRYALFKAQRVSNLHSYNQKSGEPLPTIWLVHDEFADWMQIDSYRAGVESAVSRLGVKARAAGIYLVFAAQRPDATVFPMQLRSNLGNRLVLRVDSAGTSDLSLGVKGGAAERLLGKGHLAALLGGGTAPVYAQVPFVGQEELEELVDAIVQDLAGR